MKVQRTRRATGAYLVSGGTLLQMFDELADNNHIGSTFDITYNYCKVFIYDGASDFTSIPGRIALSRDANGNGFVQLAKGGRVTAKMPNLKSGSDNTRKHGFKVQYVALITKQGLSLDWTDVTDIISSTFNVQVGANYTVPINLRPGDRLWGYPVLKVKDRAQYIPGGMTAGAAA